MNDLKTEMVALQDKLVQYLNHWPDCILHKTYDAAGKHCVASCPRCIFDLINKDRING